MIEARFDVPFIADLARREKQIQQNYRPVIAVHKWFARRPGTLFRGLLLAEFGEGAVSEDFYRGHVFSDIRVADPFMGGGTPLLEANRLGCDVTGFDINPMAVWVVKRELERLDLSAYLAAAEALRNHLGAEVGHLYRTRCAQCGRPDAPVKYFLWVKTLSCAECGAAIDLFPGYRIAGATRHPRHVFVCAHCGSLTETDDAKSPGDCAACGRGLETKGPAKRSRVSCPGCGAENRFPRPEEGPPVHRMIAVEYHCPDCKPGRKGRFFKSPDVADLAREREAQERFVGMEPRFVPDVEIPAGDESDRLHRWGYRRYAEMFNARQLLGLELSARWIAEFPDERVRNALSTNLSDLLRYQNLLCRYDTMALKSLDIFSIHGFPVGLIQCESNLLGIREEKRKTCVGSGGWANIIEKFHKAKAYCEKPFEVRHEGRRKMVVPVEGEWIGDHPLAGDSPETRGRTVSLHCGDAAVAEFPENSLDVVLTDPPYFGNVQYAELMDFCYVWLRRLAGEDAPGFQLPSTRNAAELTGNLNMGRGIDHFTEGLSAVFRKMAVALKDGAPLAFTYHHNRLEAYLPAAVALLDAGFVCTASLPCPAEMGASIHISGTGSSIVDTVFVNRTTGRVKPSMLPETAAELAEWVRADLELLKRGGVNPTAGDTRCVAFGHLTRLAIWNLREGWDLERPTEERLGKVSDWMKGFGGWEEGERFLAPSPKTTEQFGAKPSESSTFPKSAENGNPKAIRLSKSSPASAVAVSASAGKT